MRFELVPVSPAAPPLALDVGERGAVTVTDSSTNELIASAEVEQVTATPAKYRYMRLESLNGTQPLVILDLTDVPPIRVGVRSQGSRWGEDMYRYVWREPVRTERQPTHEVAEEEWLSLVAEFGLSAVVIDEDASGQIERRERFNKVKVLIEVALVLVVIALAAYLHFAR
jgi:hypothetical protein